MKPRFLWAGFAPVLCLSGLLLLLNHCNKKTDDEEPETTDQMPTASVTANVKTTLLGELVVSHAKNKNLPAKGAKVYLVGSDLSPAIVGAQGLFQIRIPDQTFLANHRIEGIEAPSAAIKTRSFDMYAIYEKDGKTYGIRRNDILMEFHHQVNTGKQKLTPTGVIEGTVPLGPNTELVGTAMFLAGSNFITATDDRGNYQMAGIPPGTWKLRAQRQGYFYSESQEVIVKSGETLSVKPLELALASGMQAIVEVANQSKTSPAPTVLFNLFPSHDNAVMKVSEDISLLNAVWQPVQSQLLYPFADTGIKTLYFKFSDETGEESATIAVVVMIDPAISKFGESKKEEAKARQITVSHAGSDIQPDWNERVWDFPKEWWNGEGATLAFTIKNTGQWDLLLPFGVQIESTDIKGFNIVAQPDKIIGAQETSQFKVLFRPTALSSNPQLATITIFASDDLQRPFRFRLSGSTWSFKMADGGLETGLNWDSSHGTSDPSLVVWNDKLYACWQEESENGSRIHVAVANNNQAPHPAWTFIDGAGVGGINGGEINAARRPRPIVFNDQLYLTWEAEESGSTKIRIAVYNGDDASPLWNFVDGGKDAGINFDPAQAASFSSLYVLKNRLYVVWREKNPIPQIRVAVFNGSNEKPFWTSVDGNTSEGINYHVGKYSYKPRGIVHQEKLYVTWVEDNGTNYQLRVKIYNGDDSKPVWTFKGGQLVTGLNIDANKLANDPSLCSYKGKLYLLWSEENTLVNQLRAAVYEGGDNDGAWVSLDGGSSAGLNKDPSRGVDSGRFLVYGDRLYVAWSEKNAYDVFQIRVARYNDNQVAPKWVLVDGNGSDGINYDKNQNAEQPTLTVFNETLYLIWHEGRNANQIRVAALSR